MQFGSLLAIVFALIVTIYRRPEEHNHQLHNEDKGARLILSTIDVMTSITSFLPHFYFSFLLGEKTE